MTSADAGSTEKWIESTGAKYAYGYDKSRKLMSGLGLTSMPSAVLVNPAGVVVWSGYPSGITDSVVEEHIGGALPTPVYKWPSSAKNLRKAFMKGQYAKALKDATKRAEKDQDLAPLRDALSSLIDAKVAALRTDLKRGDLLSVATNTKALAKGLKGLPAADEVVAIQKELKAIKGWKKVVKAQKKVQSITSEAPRRKKDAEEQIAALERVAKGHADDAAGTAAQAHIARLRKALGKMR